MPLPPNPRVGLSCMLTDITCTCCIELVLFQCTFVALKAKSYRTINVHPDEYEVQGENRLFQA